MRVTNDIRRNILNAATKSVPTIDYHAKLAEMIQAVLVENMLPTVLAAYNDTKSRQYLRTVAVVIKDGNGNGSSMNLYYKNGRGCMSAPFQFYGIHGDHTIYIQVNKAAVAALKKDSLSYKLSAAVIKSGFYQAHYDQDLLLSQVKARLNATLDACTTTKRLYEVLETELHHLIPADNDKVANLPATAGPVVADLRRLGAELPTVPRAKQSA